MAKYDAYKLAFNQIRRALESKPPFPIEAIAIEESILFDRLWSAVTSLVPNAPHNAPATFGGLLKLLCDQLSGDVRKEFESLEEALHEQGGVRGLKTWKDKRNKFAHGLAKSAKPGEPTEIGSHVFYEEGLSVAKDGLALVSAVKAWSTKSIRKAVVKRTENGMASQYKKKGDANSIGS